MRARLWVVASVTLGGLLVLAYAVFEGSLPRGPSEFVFWPPLEPLPFAPMRGFTFEQLMRHAGRAVILGPALLLLGLPLSRLPGLRPPGPACLRRLVIGVGVLSLGCTAAILLWLLQGRALFDDELTYRMQAALLAEGRVAEDTVPPWPGENFTIWTRRGATGKYLFGEPLVQVVGTLLGYPALLHLLLAAVTLLAWHRGVRRDCGDAVAAWATAFVALSPMFLFTTPTGLSQATSLACLACAGLGYQGCRGQAAWTGAAVLGTALGFGLTVRPQVVAPAGIVLVGAALFSLLRRRRWGPPLLLLGSGCVWVLFIGLYNRALTGSWLTLPWSLFQPLERYGFGRPLEGDPFVHSLGTAVENLAVTLVRFNGWWLGWPLSLALLALWLGLGRPLAGGRVWLGVGVALVAFQFPYYSTGVSETGPVYQYELLLPASLLGAHALDRALARWPRRTWALLVVQVLLGTTTFVVEKAARMERMMNVIHGPAEWVLARVEPPALLLYETALQENLRLGWLTSGFPVRWRSDGDPVVTYPRGQPQGVAALRRRYAERNCYYFRVDPRRLEPEVLRCEAAESLLARPYELEGPALAIPSTAMRRGWLKPF